MPLTVRLSEQTVMRVLRYMDKMTVDVIRVWRKGGVELLWVMRNRETSARVRHWLDVV